MIFISYRRSGGIDVARNIYHQLSIAGYNVFFDHDSMRDGRFDKQIFTAIDNSSDVILILSPGALDRCHNEDDWVRTEIEYALEKGKHIILLATAEDFAFPDNLPESLCKIKTLNFVIINQNYYDASLKRLRSVLKAKTKHKKYPFFILLFLILLVSAFLIYSNLNLASYDSDDENVYSPQECTAQLYLMRYSDLSLQYEGCYSKNELEVFQYEDSINSTNDVCIYPTSKVLSFDPNNIVYLCSDEDSINYHNPILRLKLHNKQRSTLIFNHAILEISDFHPIQNPVMRVASNEKELKIINETQTVLNGHLDYAFLNKEESFVKYNKQLVINNLYEFSILPSERGKSFRGKLFDKFILESSDTVRIHSEHQEELPIFSYLVNETDEEVEIQRYNSIKTGQRNDFSHSLRTGETDDEAYFSIRSEISSTFKVRMKLLSTDGRFLYTPFVTINYFKPRTGKENPNYLK